MRIDGEQETEGAADAMDVCGWLISLDLISMIVDPPDGVPHSIGLISRRNSAVSKMTPILGDFNEPPLNLLGRCVCLSALRSACGRDHQSRMGRARQ